MAPKPQAPVPACFPPSPTQQQQGAAAGDAGAEDEQQRHQQVQQPLLPLGQLTHLLQLDVALCDHREADVVPLDPWVRQGLVDLQGLTSLRYDLLPPRVVVSSRARDTGIGLNYP